MYCLDDEEQSVEEKIEVEEKQESCCAQEAAPAQPEE